MTIVVARQFEDRIIVVSDTMISDISAAQQSILPGRLKSVVIDWYLSIAYAGSANTGLEAIRSARILFANNRDLNDVLLFLKGQTEGQQTEPSNCDFLVVSHLDGPSIYKIWDGKISSGQPSQWIGNPEPLVGLNKREALIRPPDGLSDSESEEYRFCSAFKQIQLEPAGMAANGIGGFLILQLGSPYGYCYLSHAASVCADTIMVPPGLTETQLSDRATGMTEYRYNIRAPAERGVGVVGAFLEQAKTGYIYAPLKRDDPIPISPTTLKDMCEKTASVAREMGGRTSEVELQ